MSNCLCLSFGEGGAKVTYTRLDKANSLKQGHGRTTGVERSGGQLPGMLSASEPLAAG